MATISILANAVRPSVDRRSDDTAFWAGTYLWQDPVHCWKAGPGEVTTLENLFIYYNIDFLPKTYLCNFVSLHWKLNPYHHTLGVGGQSPINLNAVGVPVLDIQGFMKEITEIS